MKILNNQSIDLTYCLNVHPGEKWPENLQAIMDYTLPIKNHLASDKPFGLGLRLSNQAANYLSTTAVLNSFKEFLQKHNFYVFSINGFPYGPFHGSPIKENAYAPDWRTQERLNYTLQLAGILSKLIPKNASGSISTLPLSYKNWIQTDQDLTDIILNLCELVINLSKIEETTGRYIHVGLEPEPDCLIENTEDTIRFFNRELIRKGRDLIRQKANVSLYQAENIIRRYLGVCFDTCHLATQFEDLTRSLNLLLDYNIKISKIQISAALKLIKPSENMSILIPFSDPVYLHQVKAMDWSNRITSFSDLPVVLRNDSLLEKAYKEWRIHYHVPLYFKGNNVLQSTNDDLTPAFFKSLIDHNVDHWELETYTFDVLPPEMRSLGLIKSIVKEYEWVLSQVIKTGSRQANRS